MICVILRTVVLFADFVLVRAEVASVFGFCAGSALAVFFSSLADAFDGADVAVLVLGDADGAINVMFCSFFM